MPYWLCELIIECRGCVTNLPLVYVWYCIISSLCTLQLTHELPLDRYHLLPSCWSLTSCRLRTTLFNAYHLLLFLYYRTSHATFSTYFLKSICSSVIFVSAAGKYQSKIGICYILCSSSKTRLFSLVFIYLNRFFSYCSQNTNVFTNKGKYLMRLQILYCSGVGGGCTIFAVVQSSFFQVVQHSLCVNLASEHKLSLHFPSFSLKLLFG